MVYKIGTRGSLLAVTQSSLILNELSQLSGEKFELVKIKTLGDELTHKPLWQLDGKDFFTRELDSALLENKVDLVIHSYKDLGSKRPEGIFLGAITKRDFPHDILLIKKEVQAKLKNFQGNFKIGTSSPRRICQVEQSLKELLPFQNPEKVKLNIQSLRGNVNTRIEKLRIGQFDAILLALAGLERLAQHPESEKKLKILLGNLSYSVLPLSTFPAAAAQGALAIEINKMSPHFSKLKNILSKLNHQKTALEVKEEKKLFASYGGGCHLSVGLSVQHLKDHLLIQHKGVFKQKEISVRKLKPNTHYPRYQKVFIGINQSELFTDSRFVLDEFIIKTPLHKTENLDHQHIFVTSKHVMHQLFPEEYHSSLWSAGVMTWKKMARLGYWVNGSSDSLGEESLLKFKNSKALRLMSPNLQLPWKILTHTTSKSQLGPVVASYERSIQSTTKKWEKNLELVQACYWTSYPQYEIYLKKFPYLINADHYCGAGKTYDQFKKNNIAVKIILKMSELKNLI